MPPAPSSGPEPATDAHIQPKLNAQVGCHKAFVKAQGIQEDFAIQGGDYVFDALEANAERATLLRNLQAS